MLWEPHTLLHASQTIRIRSLHILLMYHWYMNTICRWSERRLEQMYMHAYMLKYYT